MVISPTLDFSRAISSSRSSRSRSFKAVAAPASARSRHSVSLAMETFVCRATRSSAGAVAGWDLHPLESAAFSRRTPIADIADYLCRDVDEVAIEAELLRQRKRSC